MIASSNKYWFSSGLHWAYICSAIAFAENSAIRPSGNSTLYNLVSRICTRLLVPTRLPSWLTEFRQPLQVQSHLEMPGILFQLGHIQSTWKLAPQIDLKWSPTRSLRRYQAICPLSKRDGRYVCQISRAQRTHSRP